MATAINPQLSIIIPVYNETAVIQRTLNHLTMACAALQPEVIVVDGHPRGNTAALVNAQAHFGGLDLKAVIAKKSGRAVQMNTGADLSTGDILLFLHADTVLSAQAANRIPGLLKDGAITCGAFSLGIRHRKKAYRLIETMANLRSQMTRLPYGDQAQFFRRGYFDRLGGFANIPLMEDVEIMQRVKKRRERCRIQPEKVYTSARRWEQEGALYCTLRNWTLISLYSMGVSPRRLVKYYNKP